MRTFLSRGYKGQVYPVFGTLASREQYEKNKDIFSKYLLYMLVSWILSPILFMVVFFFFMYRYNIEFYSLFFRNRSLTSKYKDMLMPMVAPTLFSAVGYRVYPEELDEHLQLINSDYKEDLRELAKRGEQMSRDMSRQFGFDLNKLCRHIFYVGTTGAGKSETIMAFFTDVIRNGGGIGFIDGKADIVMEGRMYNLCKEEYYETQFNVINFSSPEKSPDTNTYAPLLSYGSAMKASEFLGEYIGGGGGSQDYFANRSKVMLGNVIRHYKNRQYYYNENFSFSDVSQGRDHVEMTNIFSLAYGICLEIEEVIKDRLKVSTKFKAFMNKARGLKIPQLEEIENLELLHEYLNQNSTVIYLIERELGINFEFISNYFILYSHIGEYIKGVSPSWHKYTIALAKASFITIKSKNRNYLYTKPNAVKMRDIRENYIGFKRKNEDFEKVLKYLAETEKDIHANFVEGTGHNPQAKESLEKLEGNAIIQHQYAIQGWDRVFDLFKAYQKIMGVVNPDVDGEDVVRNNKVLFVGLPATELSGDLLEALGKLIILMFKNIASIALGGTKQSATSVQFKIYQHKIKPAPVYLMVTDEIGSYMPTSGLSLIASQVRSLQIALIISGQDVVSVEPNGADGKRERARLMANLAKIILQTRDLDTQDLERLVPDVEVIETDQFVRSAVTHDVIMQETATVKKVKMFDIGLATKFVKGFGVYLDGAKEEPVYFQSYYLGDNIKQALQIRRHNAFNSIYNEFELEVA